MPLTFLTFLKIIEYYCGCLFYLSGASNHGRLSKTEGSKCFLLFRFASRGVICVICAVHALLEVEKNVFGSGLNPVVRHHQVRRAVSRVSFSPVHHPFVQLYMRALLFLFPLNYRTLIAQPAA